MKATPLPICECTDVVYLGSPLVSPLGLNHMPLGGACVIAFLSKLPTAGLGQLHCCAVLLPISLMMVQGLPARRGVNPGTQEHHLQKHSLMQSWVISPRTRHTLGW